MGLAWGPQQVGCVQEGAGAVVVLPGDLGVPRPPKVLSPRAQGWAPDHEQPSGVVTYLIFMKLERIFCFANLGSELMRLCHLLGSSLCLKPMRLPLSGASQATSVSQLPHL